MNKRICDYCGEPWPKLQIKLTRTPNAESIYAELCDVCLADIVSYANQVEGNDMAAPDPEHVRSGHVKSAQGTIEDKLKHILFSGSATVGKNTRIYGNIVGIDSDLLDKLQALITTETTKVLDEIESLPTIRKVEEYIENKRAELQKEKT
jgi:hypothetical protein